MSNQKPTTALTHPEFIEWIREVLTAAKYRLNTEDTPVHESQLTKALAQMVEFVDQQALCEPRPAPACSTCGLVENALCSNSFLGARPALGNARCIDCAWCGPIETTAEAGVCPKCHGATSAILTRPAPYCAKCGHPAHGGRCPVLIDSNNRFYCNCECLGGAEVAMRPAPPAWNRDGELWQCSRCDGLFEAPKGHTCKGAQIMNTMALPSDDPMMKAWNEWCSTDEFKSALRWAVETKYDDGRPISDIQREQHAKGAMWLAFTKTMESRLDYLETEQRPMLTREQVREIQQMLHFTDPDPLKRYLPIDTFIAKLAELGIAVALNNTKEQRPDFHSIGEELMIQKLAAIRECASEMHCNHPHGDDCIKCYLLSLTEPNTTEAPEEGK